VSTRKRAQRVKREVKAESQPAPSIATSRQAQPIEPVALSVDRRLRGVHVRITNPRSV
jgi:hypothetical protein